MPFRTTTFPIALGLALAPLLLASCDGGVTPAASELASLPSDGGASPPSHAGRDAGASCGLARPVRGALRTSTGSAVAPVTFAARRDGSLVVSVGTSAAPILELRLVEESATTHTLARGSWPNGSPGDFVLSVPASAFPGGCGTSAHLRLYGVVRIGASNADVEWRANGSTTIGLDYVPCCDAGDAGCAGPHGRDWDDEDCDVDEDVDEGSDERAADGGSCSGGHGEGSRDRPRH